MDCSAPAELMSENLMFAWRTEARIRNCESGKKDRGGRALSLQVRGTDTAAEFHHAATSLPPWYRGCGRGKARGRRRGRESLLGNGGFRTQDVLLAVSSSSWARNRGLEHVFSARWILQFYNFRGIKRTCTQCAGPGQDARTVPES
eukprot:3584095-Rhodomonas_salina.3